MAEIPDWQAVLIGVTCGVAAGIPTSLLIMEAMARREASRFRSWYQQEQPPIIIIGNEYSPISPYNELQQLDDAVNRIIDAETNHFE